MGKTLTRAIDYIFKGIPKVNVKVDVGMVEPSNILKGKKILITGGGRGLGFAIAKKCVAEGAEVLICGRSSQTLEKAASELGDCLYSVFDVTDYEHIPSFVQECSRKLGGRIDVLVNNAGISLHEGSIYDVTLEGFDAQFGTNLKGPYFLSKAFLNNFKATGNSGGSIIFVTSERGLYCDDQPYGLTKAAVCSLTQGLARRALKDGVRVNAVAPGVTVSDMTGVDRNGNLFRPGTSGGRVLLPEEIAETVVFLISDASRSINGAIIPCDEGNHIRCDW